MTLRFTWLAVDDLARLRAFIAKDNPQAARCMSQSLRQSIEHLADHPNIGTALEYERNVRQWVAGDYVVHYQYENDDIVVLRIWHGREHHPST